MGVLDLIRETPNGQPSLVEQLVNRMDGATNADGGPDTESYHAGRRSAYRDALQIVNNWAASMDMQR